MADVNISAPTVDSDSNRAAKARECSIPTLEGESCFRPMSCTPLTLSPSFSGEGIPQDE